MRRGPLATEKAPMRQEPLVHCGLFADVRAGWAAARSFVAGLKIRLRNAEGNPDSSSPGLTASFPAAREGRSGQEACRFAVPQEEDGHASKARMASGPASQAM